MQFISTFVALAFLLFPSSSFAFDFTTGSGLQVGVAGDLTGTAFSKRGEAGETNFKNGPHPREMEFSLFSPVDQTIDGALVMNTHNEGGEYHAEMHEAYVRSSRLIPGVRFKLGYYFLNIGRLNSFHRHDWPFINAPTIHESLFGEEAAQDVGGEVSYLFKQLPFYLDATLGVSSGRMFIHGQPELNPVLPTHYLKLSTFFETSENTSFLWEATYLRRKNETEKNVHLIGTNFVLKNQLNAITRKSVMFEGWAKIQDEKPLTLGAYVYPEFRLGESRFFLGARADATHTKEDALTGDPANTQLGISPLITFKNSEFFLVRGGVSTLYRLAPLPTDALERRVELQIVFILGAHPAHDY